MVDGPGVRMPVPPTCAAARVQPISVVSIAAVNTRRIIVSIFLTQRPGRANWTARPTLSISLFGASAMSPTMFQVAAPAHHHRHAEISRSPAGTIK